MYKIISKGVDRTECGGIQVQADYICFSIGMNETFGA